MRKLKESESLSLKTKVEEYENPIARPLEREESLQRPPTEVGLECEKVQREVADIKKERMFVDQKDQTAIGEQRSLF